MGDKWIEVQKELPPGIMIIEEKYRSIVDRIHELCDEDLWELEAFLDFLAEGSKYVADDSDNNSQKIFDFMTGGMQRAG